MEHFRVRLNCIDSYQSAPTKFDPQLQYASTSQRNATTAVPVIRVFGSTETGQKVCVHIHGAFPYMYIEYTGSLLDDEVNTYIDRLHLSIDHALSVSYRRNYDRNARYVAKITMVKGIPFYGFHVGYRFFLKIYTFNPIVTTRLADLLRQGAVMNEKFQPYEAHIQHLPQWMIDYNLYGCGYIDCSQAYFRSPIPSAEDMESAGHLWHDKSIPASHVLNEFDFPRVSHCALEVDICVQDILNRHDIRPRHIHHDFAERIGLQESGRLVPSMEGLWRDETRRRKSQMSDAPVGSSPFPPEVMVSMSADPRSSQSGGWIHEEEYRDSIEVLINGERACDESQVTFDSFIDNEALESTIQTVLQSVEDLYPNKLGTPASSISGFRSGCQNSGDLPQSDFLVDEKRILSLRAGDDSEYYSDEEEIHNEELSYRSQGDKHDKALADGDYDSGIETEHFQEAEEENTKDMAIGIPMSSEKESSVAQYDEESLQAEARHTLDQAAKSRIGAAGTTLKNLRRPASNETIQNTLKRAKLDIPGSNSWEVTDDEDDNQSQDSQPDLLDEILGRRPFQNSQEKSTVHNLFQKDGSPTKNRTLNSFNFPVVKDPNDPSTVLRLSQSQNQSQKSAIDSPFKTKAKRDSDIDDHGNSTSTSETGIFQSSATPSVLRKLAISMGHDPRAKRSLIFSQLPPNSSEVLQSQEQYGVYPVLHQDAHYSKDVDVPDRSREYAGRGFRLDGITAPFLPEFDATGMSNFNGGKQRSYQDRENDAKTYQRRRKACGLRSWEIAEPPPTFVEVKSWLDKESQRLAAGESMQRTSDHCEKLSQIEGATQKASKNDRQGGGNPTSVKHETQYMSTMSLEVHVNTRDKYVPNPEEDPIQCVFWCFRSDDTSNGADLTTSGIVVLSEDRLMGQRISKQVNLQVDAEDSELDLLLQIVSIVRTFDPDVLTGYEVHGTSWGYLMERARFKYDLDFADEISRMISKSHGRFGKENDRWGFNTTSSIRVTGRHTINIWRAMRAEMNLLQYTMENVVFELMRRRIPHYCWKDLTSWYSSGDPKTLNKVLRYYLNRVQLDLEILDRNDLIPRTSEQARLLGVDFFSVFSRGSQFKVESLMFRIAKPENFMLISPSRRQVAGQNALECLPLVMEPQSSFYSGPVLVLDFQSLYPSIMIAYNYCYSTFLGRIVRWRGTNKMGFTEYKRQRRLLELLKDDINIAPNGMMYVKQSVRKSLLAKMLTEILETRVMVKSGMKMDKDDARLQKLLNNRQLALKLIANVTYGYTSASFSGRMPCSEIADSIVQTGRETLERSIALIHSIKRWGAEVVYGDTDSLFIHVKGRTREQAFQIGEEISKTITEMNPRPVKLKFEKVYHPCVLLAKKRYVGYKYESRDQTKPEFEAKGIETVRRDGTPAEQRIEEKALRILFETADLSQVKSYFQRQCEKIMKGSVSVQDFCYAREVKLGTYSDKGPPPAGALISTRKMLQDARAEPQYGERVPYVVVVGAPGARLIDRCVSPEELLYNDHLELDSEYYISKNIIPPLERIFNLVGANVRSWYDEMPKVQRIRRTEAGAHLALQTKGHGMGKKTLESYLRSSSCLVCNSKKETESPICDECLATPDISTLMLRLRLQGEERRVLDLERICQSCSGSAWTDEIKCDSKDCPVFYSRTREKTRLKNDEGLIAYGLELLEAAADGSLEW